MGGLGSWRRLRTTTTAAEAEAVTGNIFEIETRSTSLYVGRAADWVVGRDLGGTVSRELRERRAAV